MNINLTNQNSQAMKAITLNTADNGYNDLICRYFLERFPKSFKVSKNELLEIITEILVGNKDVRYGATPKPEQLVVVRNVIKTAIANSLPIPVLVPWGGKKTDSSISVDIAEVNAIWTLTSLDNLIRNYYSPGLALTIRIEDTGAYWLYRDEKASAPSITRYSGDVVKLVNILKGDSKINPVLESSLMKQADYCDMSQKYSDLIYDYLIQSQAFPEEGTSLAAYNRLVETGWLGEIPREQREYYTDRYKALYPDLKESEALRLLADYLGGAKARYDLNGRATPIVKTVHGEAIGHIQFTFVPPVPGAPESLFNNTLYYRTVSLKDARTHIAPWRAKGFLEIDGNKIKSKITSFNDAKLAELIPGTVKLVSEDGATEVEIGADQIVPDNTAMYYAIMGAPMM